MELGCGTGRLLAPLARAGFAVTGVDNSPAMLKRAHERLQELDTEARQGVRLVEGEIAALSLAERRYRLAFAAYNTFLHLEPATAVAACASTAAHLADDGRFFIDLPNPHHVVNTPDDPFLTLERTLFDAETGRNILVMASNRLEEAAQILTITWVYDATPTRGGPVHRTVAEIDYHYYFPHQLELILEEGGLQLEALYGAYNEKAFDETSERLLVLASKAIPS